MAAEYDKLEKAIYVFRTASSQAGKIVSQYYIYSADIRIIMLAVVGQPPTLKSSTDMDVSKPLFFDIKIVPLQKRNGKSSSKRKKKF